MEVLGHEFNHQLLEKQSLSLNAAHAQRIVQLTRRGGQDSWNVGEEEQYFRKQLEQTAERGILPLNLLRRLFDWQDGVASFKWRARVLYVINQEICQVESAVTGVYSLLELNVLPTMEELETFLPRRISFGLTDEVLAKIEPHISKSYRENVADLGQDMVLADGDVGIQLEFLGEVNRLAARWRNTVYYDSGVNREAGRLLKEDLSTEERMVMELTAATFSGELLGPRLLVGETDI